MLKTLLRLLPPSLRKKSNIIHVVRLEGGIATGRSFGGSLINMEAFDPILKKAFKKGIAGVALAINCPGGSPVQSALIASRIRALSAEHKIPVYAFCEDVAASGGYWLACAADEIYADENSIVGSIGVISMGFGFPEALKKLGIERRVYTSGESKSTNDPFKPEKPEDVARLKTLLEEMHQSFKALVRERRDGKLADDADIFTGAFWTGTRAKELGLVDGIGHLTTVLKQKFGDKVEIKKIDAPSGLLKRFGLASGANFESLPHATLQVLEDRALWSRFGL